MEILDSEENALESDDERAKACTDRKSSGIELILEEVL